MCDSHEDCVTNFQAIYKEWQAEENQSEGSEPIDGEMLCSNAKITMPDPDSGEITALDVKVCTPMAYCDGHEHQYPDSEMKINIEAGACEGSIKLMTGFATVAAVATYLFI